MRPIDLPEFVVPDSMARDDMPDLLRHWYLGPRGRRHMMLRRFAEVDGEVHGGPGDRVLDIGSAWGFNVLALRALGYRAVGIDLVVDQFPAGREIARANDVDLVVAGADAAALPFRDARFDAVTMVETFEHIFESDRPGAMREVFRVLRPGGRLVLSTPNYGSLIERAKRFVAGRPALRRRLPVMMYPSADSVSRDAYHPYHYHQPLSDRGIARLLESAGFSVESTRHFLFTLKNTRDSVAPAMFAVEAMAERTPGLRRLAATVRVVATRPSA